MKYRKLYPLILSGLVLGCAEKTPFESIARTSVAKKTTTLRSPAVPDSGSAPRAQPGDTKVKTCSAEFPSTLRKKTKAEIGFALEDLTGYAFFPVQRILASDPGTSTYPSSDGDLSWDKLSVSKQVEFAESVALRLQRDLKFQRLYSPGGVRSPKIFVSLTAQMFLSGQASPELLKELEATFENSGSTEDEKFFTGVRASVFRLILDPMFLYDVPLNNQRTSLSTAKRLASFIWRSIPDKDLLLAAASNKLTKPQDIDLQVERMLADPKALRSFHGFVRDWLSVSALSNTQRSAAAFPEFSPALLHAMERDLLFQMTEVLYNQDKPLSTLMKKIPDTVDVELAPILGFQKTKESGNVKVELPPERTGILTHPAFSTLLSVGDGPNAVKRANYTLERFLCITLPPPPVEGGVFKATSLPVDATTRDKFKVHSDNPSCAACHSMMDGIGLSLERYDALGKHRIKYASGKEIDPSGSFKGAGLDLNFKDVIDFQLKLSTVGASQVNNCFVTNVFENAVRSKLDDSLACAAEEVAKKTAQGGYKTIVKEIVKSPAFWRD